MSEWEFFRLDPPHDAYVCVRTIERIRLNATGEVREAPGYCIWDDEDAWTGQAGPSTSIWRDGNNSCDCNRELYFRRAGGEGDGDDVECTDGRYSVQLVNAKTGRVFYDEFSS